MVHTFRYTHNGKPLYFLWDIESGSLLNVDYVAFLCAKKKYAIDLTPDELSDYNALDDAIKSEVCGEIDELEQEGTLLSVSMRFYLFFYPSVFNADLMTLRTV